MSATTKIITRMTASRTAGGLLVLGALASCGGAIAVAPARAATRTGATVTLPVTIDASRPGRVLPSGFVGLSFEAPALGSPTITSGASHLPSLLRALGSGLLRFSGDSVDHTQWLPAPAAPAPWAIAATTPANLDHLAVLTRATGWRALLGLNLGHPDSSSAADEARAAAAALGSSLAGLEIGNEPDLYARPVPVPFRSVLGAHALRDPMWGFTSYSAQVAALRRAVATAAPAVSQWGPATATFRWLSPFVAQKTTGVAVLTQHYYPFDRCHAGRLLAHGTSIQSLLSRHAAERESRQITGAVAAGARRGLPLRVDEANSVACGGQPNTSDTFASALWAVDFGLLAARAGAVGVDFHGGLGSCQAMGTLVSPWYSPLCAQPDGQLRPLPEYYGLLLLSYLEGGAFVPTVYRTSSNLTVSALRTPDGTLRVVINDMDAPAAASGGAPLRVVVALRVGSQYQHASVVRLSAPSIGAKHAITLGGASVAPDGSFPGAASTPIGATKGLFPVAVAPGSATLVNLGA